MNYYINVLSAFMRLLLKMVVVKLIRYFTNLIKH